MSSTETETTTQEQKNESSNEKQFTQDELNQIIQREKQKAEKSATSSFLSELGFSSTDELKNVVTAFKDHQEKNKTAEQRLAELEAEREQLGSKANKYESAINSLLEQEVALVPEDKRSLIPEEITDPAAKLAWITRNRQFLTGKAPVNVGSSTEPAAPVPTAPVSYDEFKKMKPQELIAFHKDFPEIAQDYSKRLRQGL